MIHRAHRKTHPARGLFTGEALDLSIFSGFTRSFSNYFAFRAGAFLQTELSPSRYIPGRYEGFLIPSYGPKDPRTFGPYFSRLARDGNRINDVFIKSHTQVHVSLLFLVSKDDVDVRPVSDVSFKNLLIIIIVMINNDDERK